MKLRIIFLFSLVLCVSFFCGTATAEPEQCGTNAYWSLDGTKLSIWGAGRMYDENETALDGSSYSYCWWDDITEVHISSGITYIGKDAFQACRKLSVVKIPASVTEIGEWAFSQCDSLKSVTFLLKNNVQAIGAGAFSDSALESFDFPAALKNISESTFSNCSNLKSAKLPEGLKTIDASAFAGCTSLKEIVIPKSVTSIDGWAFAGAGLQKITVSHTGEWSSEWIEEAFRGCPLKTLVLSYDSSAESTSTPNFLPFSTIFPELQTLIVSNGITGIGIDNFAHSKHLTSITFPDSLTGLATCAFQDATSLVSVTLPKNMTFIGNYAFEGCTSLKTINIPSGITEIDTATFKNCSNLKNIIIPNGVYSIADHAFENSGLQTITLPQSTYTISDAAFLNCNHLTDVNYSGTKAQWDEMIIGADNECLTNAIIHCKSDDGSDPAPDPGSANPEIGASIKDPEGKGKYVYTSNGTAAYTGPVKDSATIEVPDEVNGIQVTEIKDKAFSKCKKLKTIKLGKNVKSIGKNAFSGCENLKTVKGGANVEIINASAFSGCSKLSKLPAFTKLKTIGASAFKDCKSLKKITIEKKVSSIGKKAFTGCTNLKKITIKSILLTKKNVKSGAFKGINAKATIKCPKEKLKEYKKLLKSKGVPKTAKIK